jgi:large subunit ribosomal protein L21
VVESGGMQYTVEEGSSVKVPFIDGNVGDKVTLDKVLLISGGKEPKVGQPYLDSASVEAELLAHGKDDKVIVYKKKKRTKYRRTQGHRQKFTELRITRINSPD